MSGPSREELNLAVDILQKIKPGFLDFSLFVEISRLSVASIIELVPVRLNTEDEVEVLLFKRSPEDTFWSEMWANPGTVLRPTDKKDSFLSAFERIYTEDMQNFAAQEKPHHAETVFTQSERGSSLSAVHWIEVDRDYGGTFFAIDNLPDDTVSCTRDILHLAVSHYRNQLA